MAAVATRSSNSSPHLSSMSSPKRSLTVKHDDQHKSSPLQRSQEARRATPPRQDVPTIADTLHADTKPGATATATGTTAQPLAPPPRPISEVPDYFNQAHSVLSTEANPFEHAFGGSSIDTPGKSLLPSVAALTSPSSLLPGGTPGWAGSLRSGPLSPAMLTGPTGQSDYFDPHFRGSFPTPNESSMRTGLTPGGGGSMFPAPSPNSQALFQQLQSGGATPSTLDFHRTALSAAAQAKANSGFSAANNPPATTQTSDPSVHISMDTKQYSSAPAVQQPQADPFGQHDAEAANSLFLLTQSNGARTNGSYAVPAQQNHIQQNMHQMPNHMGTQSQETSPLSKRAPKNSISSITGSADTGEHSDSGEEQAKPTTRSRGTKKNSTTKVATTNNSRRKASETPAKPPANKKTKVNNVHSNEDDDDDSDEDMNMQIEGQDGKKMTDEEKRKNFLERNRVAALKCRQRKKQWLANLQAKVEIFSAENDQLSATVTQLREEIVNLKTLLLAHKECPVSSQQGLQGSAMVAFVNGDMGQASYGMGMPPPPNGMMLPVGGQMPPMSQR